MPILSIIVPVYQAENYLKRCLDSLLNQNVSDFELILVNDGSTDRSGAICDEYSAMDNRVQVIHKVNEGQTKTRKKGLFAATGEYVSFVDSDDWVDRDFFSRLIEKAKEQNADVVVAGYITQNHKEEVISTNGLPSGVYRNESLQELLNQSLYYIPEKKEGIAPAMWAKLFRRESAVEAMTKRDDTIRFGEDSLCTNQILSLSRTVVIDNSIAGYHYFLWNGSVTQRFNPRYFDELSVLFDELKIIISRYPGTKACESLAYNYVNLFVGGVLQFLHLKTDYTFFSKYRRIKHLCSEERLSECIELIQFSNMSSSLLKTLSQIKQKRAFSLVFYHTIRAKLSRVKTFILKNR